MVILFIGGVALKRIWAFFFVTFNEFKTFYNFDNLPTTFETKRKETIGEKSVKELIPGDLLHPLL